MSDKCLHFGRGKRKFDFGSVESIYGVPRFKMSAVTAQGIFLKAEFKPVGYNLKINRIQKIMKTKRIDEINQEMVTVISTDGKVRILRDSDI